MALNEKNSSGWSCCNLTNGFHRRQRTTSAIPRGRLMECRLILWSVDTYPTFLDVEVIFFTLTPTCTIKLNPIKYNRSIELQHVNLGYEEETHLNALQWSTTSTVLSFFYVITEWPRGVIAREDRPIGTYILTDLLTYAAVSGTSENPPRCAWKFVQVNGKITHTKKKCEKVTWFLVTLFPSFRHTLTLALLVIGRWRSGMHMT